jgi:hypothetical protein
MRAIITITKMKITFPLEKEMMAKYFTPEVVQGDLSTG